MSILDILHSKGRHVVKAQPTDSVLSAVRKMAEQRIGAVVIEDSWMRPVGIFSERDFVNAIARHGQTALGMSVESLMTAAMVSCLPSERVETALATMTAGKFRHLPVIDDGKLVGIVSIGDLVKHRLDEKELEADVLRDRMRMRA